MPIYRLGSRHQPASKTPFKWCFAGWRVDDGPTLNADLVAVIFEGIRTSIAKKPYIFCDFSGWGGGSKPPVKKALCLPPAQLL